MAKGKDIDKRASDEHRQVELQRISTRAPEHSQDLGFQSQPSTDEFGTVTSRAKTPFPTGKLPSPSSGFEYLSVPPANKHTQTYDSLQTLASPSQPMPSWINALLTHSRDLIQVLQIGPENHLSCSFVSDNAKAILGYTPHELLAMPDASLIHPDDLAYARSALNHSRQNNIKTNLLEFRARHKDGTWRYLESYAVNCLQNSQLQGFVVSSRDVTDSRDRETHLLNRVAWFAALSNQTTDALRVVQADGSIQVASGRLSWLFGEDSNGLNVDALLQRTHPDDIKQVEEGLNHAMTSPDARIRLGFRARDPKQEWRYVELELLNCLEDNLIQGVIMTGRDMTTRKLFDPATRLPNRTLFLDRVERLLHRRQHTPDEEFAVLVAEIDRYKEVTDGLGTALGDRLLKTISSRLVVSVRPADFVGRLDRDKFTILLHGLRDPADVARICQRIHESVEQPCFLGGHRVFTTVTLGAALSTSAFHSAADMLHAAEAAMHRGKQRGGSTTEMFDPTMGEEVRYRLQIEGVMRYAIERQEFKLHYQPIVSLDSSEVAGFEALCRWQRPDGSHVSPGIFIPIAEETGMINPLGEWILRRACEQAQIWEKNTKYPTFISVNLSGRQLARPEIVGEVSRVLQQTGLDPQRLKLEVTETSLITNADQVATTLHALRDLGLRLSLDDFGTGYSSLSYLHRFPFDTIKIDMSFVAMLGKQDGNESAAIIPTIIHLAESLNMNVIAEGIETTTQAQKLIEMGCAFGQGFLFARGLPEAQLDAVLRRRYLRPAD